jgi:hypothetical protein
MLFNLTNFFAQQQQVIVGISVTHGANKYMSYHPNLMHLHYILLPPTFKQKIRFSFFYFFVVVMIVCVSSYYYLLNFTDNLLCSIY